MNKIYRKVSFAAVCLLALIITMGCGNSEGIKSDVTIKETGDGFFVFEGENEKEKEEIRKLNDEIEDQKEEYNKSLFEENENWSVACNVDHSDVVEQGTVFITIDKTGLSGKEETEKNLCSYAFNKNTGVAYTAKNALEESGMTGVELSMKIDKAFKVLEPDLLLHKTEMQGFLLDEKTAEIKFIYMKVIGYDNKDTSYEEFYLYDPAADAMAKLEWP